MRDEPKSRVTVPNCALNLEPTKGVGRLRQQDGGHGSRKPLRTDPYPPPGNSQASMMRRIRAVAAKPRARKPGRERRRDRGSPKIARHHANLEKGIGLKFLNRTRLTATLGSPETPGGASEELSFLFNSLPTLETAQPEVGSSGWKSTATPLQVRQRPGALENRRTESAAHAWSHHNRRSGLQGKGSRQNGSEELEKDWLRVGHGVPVPNPPGCRWTARSCPAGRELVVAASPGTDGNAPWGPSPRPNSRLRTGTGQGELTA
ncbi:hypothetical protein H6P81_016044 [Aristolochia fimbriata]|uniref:Uncharacterized protein n=1 Tax=Aristolochia fimbriata TaxID=158543 RepID=A0AAV7E7V7_ARIFI|nr:hypothetical protein H6P81_016044 [Aristolochia fimbriata]